MSDSERHSPLATGPKKPGTSSWLVAIGAREVAEDRWLGRNEAGASGVGQSDADAFTLFRQLTDTTQVQFIEPVKEDSQIAKLIAEQNNAQ